MTSKIVPTLVFTFVLIGGSRSVASDLHILLGAYSTLDTVGVGMAEPGSVRAAATD